jgi:tRNA pseudouridine55 synthase
MSEQEYDMKDAVSGVLVIDKPVGMTSHDVVQAVRRGTGIRRAGHTGTLDPRASGVLVVLVGPAVRLSEFVSASDKRYQAIIRLGESTDTYDGDGEVTRRSAVDITEQQIEEALTQFEGTVEQVPPAYSAKKINGQKAYELARNGEEVELEAKEIDVYHLELLEWDPPEAIVDVYCSSGTYVRALANDLGEVLDCGGHLVGLRRTKSGEFALRDAVQLRKLQDAFDNGEWYRYLIPAAEALSDWPSRELSFEEVDLVRHGHRIPVEDVPDNPDHWVRAISQQGELVALIEYIPEQKEWQPRKVFFT